MSDRLMKAMAGLLGILMAVFLVLKVTSVIDWSWWWVTAPLTAPLAAMAIVFVACCCVELCDLDMIDTDDSEELADIKEDINRDAEAVVAAYLGEAAT